MNIGEKIQRARRSKGMTQSEFAEKLGVSVFSITKYELGQRNPKYDKLQKISLVLDIPMEELLIGYEYETIDEKTLQDYTTDELLKELFRRIGGSV